MQSCLTRYLALPSFKTAIKLWLFSICLFGFALASDAQQVIRGCRIFPSDHVLNTRVDKLPVDLNSDLYVNTIGAGTGLHPDFGSPAEYGIPFNLVLDDTFKTDSVTFLYDDESDLPPYYVDLKLLIEGGDWNPKTNNSDRHVLAINPKEGMLYELFAAYPADGGGFYAGSGAKWELNSYALRPDGWTSSDAAGLWVMPALVNYDEAVSGRINHALRMTCRRTSRPHVWPARHDAGPNTAGYPPMGQRFRLKAGFDISGFSKINQVILTALKEYGMFVADNGGNWYLTGTPDSRWDSVPLSELNNVHGSDFEAVDESSLMIDPDSAQADQGAGGQPAPTARPKPVHAKHRFLR